MPRRRKRPARSSHTEDQPLIRAVDFLVWQGYPASWVMSLTLRQFLAYLDAAARRLSLTAKAINPF